MTNDILAEQLVNAVLDCLDADTVAQVSDAQHAAAVEAVARRLSDGHGQGE